jgi:hypothetical protein
MYCAFYIVPEAKEPNQRLVVCKPFVKKPNVAWAVLRAAIRQDRTGGTLAGTEESLMAALNAIDHHDQDWPDDADRVVALVTKIAEQNGCSVVFKQNLQPTHAETHAAFQTHGLVWRPQAYDNTGHDHGLTGYLMSASASVDVPEQLTGHSSYVKINKNRAIDTITLELGTQAVQAAVEYKKNDKGESFEVKLEVDQLEDVLELACGPTGRKYKYALLVKNMNRSIAFFGTGNPANIRQAIDEYVEHVYGQQVPLEEQTTEQIESVKIPPVGHCRFWRLHQ